MNVKGEDVMLDQHTIDTVESTIPLLAEHGHAITKHFYDKMFAAHPELKNIFNENNQRDGNQARALAGAVFAYASNLNSLEGLKPAVERIANKHVSLGVTAEQYPIVGKYLLLAVQEVLNLPDGHPALGAWGRAYQQLADIFINAEEGIYQQKSLVAGGWRGFKTFVVDDIVAETSEVKSFYLTAKDGMRVPAYQAGQYIGVKVKPEQSSYDQIRQYSLSGRPGDNHFRITVKTEKDGVVSNDLHTYQAGDEVLVQVPAGVFTIDNQAKKHVLIAGGVGITPMLAMLYELLEQQTKAEDILFIQCQRDSQHHIFKAELALLHKAVGFHYRVCNQKGKYGDHQGHIDTEVLESWLHTTGIKVDEQTAMYFCGPKPFMKAMKKSAQTLGLKADKIHYEAFGPTTEL